MINVLLFKAHISYYDDPGNFTVISLKEFSVETPCTHCNPHPKKNKQTKKTKQIIVQAVLKF